MIVCFSDAFKDIIYNRIIIFYNSFLQQSKYNGIINLNKNLKYFVICYFQEFFFLLRVFYQFINKDINCDCETKSLPCTQEGTCLILNKKYIFLIRKEYFLIMAFLKS